MPLPIIRLKQKNEFDWFRKPFRTSAEFRQPLVLKEIDNFSYEEIAGVLNIPIGTVRSRIFRARKELTERLKRLFEDT